MNYERVNDRNVLTLRKKLTKEILKTNNNKA